MRWIGKQAGYGWSKAAGFGVASVALHCAVALAFPVEQKHAKPPVQAPDLVWLTLGSEGEAGAGVAPALTSAAEPARKMAAPAPRKQRARRTVPSVLEASVPEMAADRTPTSTNTDAAAIGESTVGAGEAQASTGAPAAGSLGALGGPGVVSGAGTGNGANTRGNGSGLAHGPGLLAHGSPCQHYFPAQARADEGEVQIEVEVDRAGHSRLTNVLAEMPKGHGFAHAASACASHLVFDPAVDPSGEPIAGRAKLRLRFRRS